jgi:membrane protease YdiL (CAAX protease family)
MLGLAGLRWRDARRDFGVTARDWREVGAYWSYLGFGDFRGKVAAFETVRAIAPGTAIGFGATDDEIMVLDLAGRADLADRVIAYELARSPWPKGARLPYTALFRWMQPGREDQGRRLALRSTTEFTPSTGLIFYELSIVLLARSGEYHDALLYFERVRRQVPATKVHRETLLAAAASRRWLGDGVDADLLEAEAGHAASAPMLTPEYRWSQTKSIREPSLWNAAAIVNPEVPTPHWGSVIWATALMVMAWLGLPVVLSWLAWWVPQVNAVPRARELTGALALNAGTLAAVNAYLVCTTSAFEAFVAAPFASKGTTWFWLSELLVLCVVLVALPLVEGQSLREVGWRVSPSFWRNSLLALAAALLLSSVRVAHGLSWARHARGYFPALFVGSALMAADFAALEETLFRGYLMKALMRWTSRFWLANLAQGVCFAATHVLVRHEPTVANQLGWVILAVVCGWLAHRSQSLWPPFVSHFVFDFLVLYAGVMPRYGEFWFLGVWFG